MSSHNYLKYSTVALVISASILLFVFYIIGIHPLGDQTLLTIDLKNQYISFFGYLSNVFKGESSFFYSFSQALGGEMMGLNAYYLLSPFNFIFLFFNIQTLPTAIFIITILKISLSSFTMTYYLAIRCQSYFAILGGIAYSLMSYNFVYQSNVMWLDALIYLPLVTLGLDRILKGKKSKVYIIFLTLTIISQYYIGFMVCLFSLIYFSVNFVINQLINKKCISEKYKPLKIFIIESLLSGLIGAIVFIPLLFSFSDGASEGKLKLDLLTDFSRTFTIKEFFSKFFLGSFNYEQIKWNGLPNIYSSILIIPGTILYYIFPEEKFSKKISYLLIVIILFLGMYYTSFYTIWHAFTSPVWFNYRFSFMFSFLLIVISIIGYTNYIKNNSGTNYISLKLLVTWLLFVLTCCIVFIEDFTFLNKKLIITTSIFLLIYNLIIIFSYKNNLKKTMFLFLIVTLFTELSINGYNILKHMSYTDYNDYFIFSSDVNHLINNLPNNEPYRVEKTFHFNENDPLLFNYNGITHYSSSSKIDDKIFIKKLGYQSNGNWTFYDNGSSLESDSLLGIKYVISKRDSNLFENLHKYKDYFVLKNPYALPIAFYANGVIDSEINFNNPIQYINEIYKSIGVIGDILKPVPDKNIAKHYINLEYYYDPDNNGHTYTKIEEDQPAKLVYEINGLDEKYIEFYFSTERYSPVDLFINGEYFGVVLDQKRNTVNVGEIADNSILIEIQPKESEFHIDNEYFYEQNFDLFSSTIDNLQSQNIQFKTSCDGYIELSAFSDEFTDLVLSIPYDINWDVTVNDKRVKHTRALGGLTSIKLPSKQNNFIVLKYKPKGIIVGSFATIFSLFIGHFYFKKE